MMKEMVVSAMPVHDSLLIETPSEETAKELLEWMRKYNEVLSKMVESMFFTSVSPSWAKHYLGAWDPPASGRQQTLDVETKSDSCYNGHLMNAAVWNSRKGPIRITDMDDGHLYNTIRFIERLKEVSENHLSAWELMTEEAKRRGMNLDRLSVEID